jgi:predicted nucleic acid-binding Zn ribbon protein
MFIPERRIRKPEPEPLSLAIEKWLQQNNLEHKLRQTEIRNTWEEMMGPLIARHTSSISLENRVLKIRVDNAPLRHELFMSRSKIAAKVNSRAGRQIVLECLVF